MVSKQDKTLPVSEHDLILRNRHFGACLLQRLGPFFTNKDELNQHHGCDIDE